MYLHGVHESAFLAVFHVQRVLRLYAGERPSGRSGKDKEMMNMVAGVNGAIEAANGAVKAANGTFKAGFQYGPVTINGGGGEVSLSERYNPAAVAVGIGREVPAETRANAHITLRKLKELVESTEGVKPPSFKQLMEMESPVVAVRTVNGAVLIVYKNGFAAYEQEESHTVMAVDKLGGYRYDFVDGANEYVPEDVFEEMEWSVRLVMEGEKKLEHNRSVMAGRNETSEMDSDGTEILLWE